MEPRPYYEIVRDELRRHIEARHLPRGVVLLEGPVATLLGVSRGPVKRAFELLAEDRLIHRFNGRGYLVGPPDEKQIPKRLDLRTLGLQVSVNIQTDIQRASWQKIYGEVARSVVSCLPFGTYQISEAAICEYFRVSRTVVRDVLNRLDHDGLIEKDRWSHWTAGPLTVRDVVDHFEMRRILEPKALVFAAAKLADGELLAMQDRLDRAVADTSRLDQEHLDELEQELHEGCVLRVANRRLAAAIRQSHLPTIINRLFGTLIGLHEASDILREHRTVLENLVLKAPRAAAAALEAHLEADEVRTRAHLKVLSVFPEPDIAPYLSRVH